MGLLALDKLEAGMVLAKNVQDRNGRVLLGAGAELTQKHLTIFRTWGVSAVDVTGSDEVSNELSLPTEIDAATLDAAEKSLLPHFSHCGIEHPAIRELLRLVAIRKIRNGLC